MDRYEPYAPCPACFESCGYVVDHGNDWESGPWTHQTNIPCRFCNGDGEVPCDDVRYPDERDDEFEDVGYLAALSRVSLRGEVR